MQILDPFLYWMWTLRFSLKFWLTISFCSYLCWSITSKDSSQTKRQGTTHPLGMIQAHPDTADLRRPWRRPLTGSTASLLRVMQYIGLGTNVYCTWIDVTCSHPMAAVWGNLNRFLLKQWNWARVSLVTSYLCTGPGALAVSYQN